MTNHYLQVSAHSSCCLSPAAGIIGKVTLGPQVSVYGGAHLRGDCLAAIHVGARSNIQENAVLHVSPNFDCVVGEDVTVGHSAILHGCTIESNCLVGMGAIVLDGAVIGTGSLVGAGSLVTSNKKFPPNSLIMGSPARLVRALTDEEVERMVSTNAREYLALGPKMVEDGVMFNPGPDYKGHTGA